MTRPFQRYRQLAAAVCADGSQSDRMFAGSAGHVAQVRFAKLPAEAHGDAARESVGHTFRDMSTWPHPFLGEPK